MFNGGELDFPTKVRITVIQYKYAMYLIRVRRNFKRVGVPFKINVPNCTISFDSSNFDKIRFSKESMETIKTIYSEIDG